MINAKSQMLNGKEEKKKGFTLIELLIVVAVIGILARTVIVYFPASQKRARDTRRQSDLVQYRTAVEKYANKNNGTYINSVSAVNITTQCAALGLGTCPDDPTTTQHYQYFGTAVQYVIWGQLEASTNYFITCSNGKTGTLATQPSSSTCPL
jgi:prepilin-type N-terminal cleavage/methylation domain-containing protein